MKKFFKNEAGGVTVDWIVLIAALIGLGMVAVQTLSPIINDDASSTTSTDG